MSIALASDVNSTVYTTKEITTLGDLEHWKVQWNSLANLTPSTHALMTYEWVYNYLKHYQTDGNWVVILCVHDDKLVGALPLSLHPYPIKFANAKIARALFNHQTMSLHVLVDTKSSKHILETLFQQAFRSAHKICSIELPRIEQDSPSCQYIQQSTLGLTDFCENGASLAPISNYQDHQAKLSKNFKSNLNKARNKAQKLGELVFIDGRTKEDPITALKSFIELEASGWKGQEGTAIKCHAIDRAFYQDLVKDLQESGMLYFHSLELAGKSIASNLGLYFNNTLLLWKLGYSEEHKRLSPGNLLIEQLIQHHQKDQQPPTIDLMTNETWYNNWNMQWRPFYNSYLFKPSILGISQYLLLKLKFFVKRLVKKTYN